VNEFLHWTGTYVLVKNSLAFPNTLVSRW